jgi:LL-diaminopimelate aminotransferase
MRKVIVDPSDLLQLVGPTPLEDLERMRRRMKLRGTETIDLGRFATDLTPHSVWLDVMAKAMRSPYAFRPAQGDLVAAFCARAQAWYAERCGVRLPGRRSILITAGVREALYHLALALVNPGDSVAIPEPAYPFYRTAVRYAGGNPINLPLKESQDYQPNLAKFESKKSIPKFLILNYPHNPTSTPPDRAFYADLVKWARRHNVMVIQDFAYGELFFDHPPPISILATPGARKVAIELHSFSFTYNVPGLKLGFAVGQPDILAALEGIQGRLASVPPEYAVSAGKEAFGYYDEISKANNAEYTRRRDAMSRGLDKLGWSYRRPTAGGFFWTRVPRRKDDVRLARRLLSRSGVLVAPGSAFGESGEGYIRLSLAKNVKLIDTAMARIGKLWPQRLKQMRGTWGPSDSSA